MKLSALTTCLCISLLVHGVILSIVFAARNVHKSTILTKEDEITLQIVTETELGVPVVTGNSLVAAEPRTLSIEPVPVEQMLSPPEEAQMSPLFDITYIILTSVGKLVSVLPAQTSSQLVDPEVAPSTNVPSKIVPSVVGESKGSPIGCLKNPQPIYPKEALKRKQEGLVVLSVFVVCEGKPQIVEILQSSGHALLDEAAIQAVKHWQFTPARIGNMPLTSKVEVPIRFKLSGSSTFVMGKRS